MKYIHYFDKVNDMKNEVKNFISEFIKLCGIALFIGIVIALYKYLVIFVIKTSNTLFASREWYSLLYTISISIILMLFSYIILQREPLIRGSGLKGLKDHFASKKRDFNWVITLPGMFFNSLITFFLGIPLGAEAPSTYMGAMCGYALDDISRKDNNADDIKICMGAGFSSAFLSPFAGIFYPFEEHQCKINLPNIIKAIFVSFLAYYISEALNGYRLIRVPLEESFNFSNWPVIIIAIILITLISTFLIRATKLMEKIVLKYEHKWFIKYRFFFVATLSVLILIFFPIVGGTGLGLINHLTTHPAYYMVIIYLVVRIILFLLGIYSTASGGAFGLGVVLGALVGYTAVIITKTFMPITDSQTILITAISASAMFATMNKAPLTGLGFLITIGHYTNFLNYIIVALIIVFGSYFLTKLLGNYGPVFKKKDINKQNA